MSGSLRQKLEDEFPEFTHGLIRMLWETIYARFRP